VFTTANPPRIAVDFADTTNGVDKRHIDIGIGATSGVSVVAAAGRTRIVVELFRASSYRTRVDGDTLVMTISNGEGADVSTTASTIDPTKRLPVATGAATVSNIDFRRGADGAGQVVVELNDPRTTVDVREEGGRIVVDFQDTTLPQELLRRLDVQDFATPVFTVDATRANKDARLIVTAAAQYDQVAYQSDNQFTLELKPPPPQQAANTGGFDEDREYTGERLTLNFQDLETRAVLQLIADFSGLNIVVSDTVQGSVTLRLQNVPWDQALDIVMTTKGLDMRRNGNVIIVAPAEEIAAREQAELEALQALQTLEPLRSEFIQVN
jgi:type IV pilus assembly protein PilQ